MNDVIFFDEDFKKSSFSMQPGKRGGGGCVSVAQKNGMIAVRDTKDATKTTLYFNRDEWTAFLAGIKSGEFELAE